MGPLLDTQCTIKYRLFVYLIHMLFIFYKQSDNYCLITMVSVKTKINSFNISYDLFAI